MASLQVNRPLMEGYSSPTPVVDLLNSPKFASHVGELLDQWHLPGVAVAVIDNQTTASKGFGYACLDPKKPVTPDTLFDIASSSKSLTAASVGILVHDDERYPEVQYDATMSSLLPEDFVMADESYTKNVTVEDILSHRSGLPSHDFSYLSPRASHPDSAKSVTRNLRNLQIAAPVRTKYMYCNLMITVATYLVEKLSGLSFADFLATHFFQPLGMNSTHLQPDAAIAAGLGDRIATPYVWQDKNSSYRRVQLTQSPEAQGAGSIFTSVNDYIKWVRATMNHDSPPITKEMYKGIIRPRILENPDAQPYGDDDDDDDAGGDEGASTLDPSTSFTSYATGWEIYFYRGHQVVKHDGLTSGFGSVHFFLPGTAKVGAMIVGNAGTGNEVANILAHEIIDEALGVPAAERPDWARYVAEQDEGGDDDDEEAMAQKVRDEICPGIANGTDEPQTRPLGAYTGEYFNPGYHGMRVEVREGRLFVDATDRSFGFDLVFEHVCRQTEYIAHQIDYYEGGDQPLAAKFVFDESGGANGTRAVKMGVNLEEDLPDLIWFDRVVSNETMNVNAERTQEIEK